MKANKGIFDIFVRICSIIILILGFLLILYILLGPSFSLVDAESASAGILLANPVIICGIISVILSFKGYAKTSAIIIIVFVLIIIFNIWDQRRVSYGGIPTTSEGIPL